MKKLTLRRFCLALCLCALTFAAPMNAAAKIAPKSAPTTPKPGSAERKAIMDALRKPVQKATKFPVIFRVGHLKVLNGWAFFSGNALRADGKAIGDDFLWGETSALLRKQGKSWTVLHWGFATDTGIVDESKAKWKQAPRAIFPG